MPEPAAIRTPLERSRLRRLVLHAPNPLVRPLLRSPAHRLLSGRVLLLTYTGRRSGRAYTIPVQYVRSGDELLVTVGLPEGKLWWRSLAGDGAPVRVRVQGRELAAHARATEDPDGVHVHVRTAS